MTTVLRQLSIASLDEKIRGLLILCICINERSFTMQMKTYKYLQNKSKRYFNIIYSYNAVKSIMSNIYHNLSYLIISIDRHRSYSIVNKSFN